MIALSTDNLSNDVLAADEVLFHVDTLHNVSPKEKKTVVRAKLSQIEVQRICGLEVDIEEDDLITYTWATK